MSMYLLNDTFNKCWNRKSGTEKGSGSNYVNHKNYYVLHVSITRDKKITYGFHLKKEEVPNSPKEILFPRTNV